MNAALLQINFAALGEQITPAVVHTVSDDLMYVGYCVSSCAGYDEPKWLIKRIRTQHKGDDSPETLQTILYANGSRRFNQKWSEHLTLDYKLSPKASTELPSFPTTD